MTPDDAFPWASAQRRELIGHIRSELRILRSRQNRFREFAARLFPHWDIASPLPFELTGHLRNFPERWSVALGIYGRAIDPDVRDENVPREIPTDRAEFVRRCRRADLELLGRTVDWLLATEAAGQASGANANTR